MKLWVIVGVPLSGVLIAAVGPVWMQGLYLGICGLLIALGVLSWFGQGLSDLWRGITDRSVSVIVIPERPKDPTAETDYPAVITSRYKRVR